MYAPVASGLAALLDSLFEQPVEFHSISLLLSQLIGFSRKIEFFDILLGKLDLGKASSHSASSILPSFSSAANLQLTNITPGI